jgi:hypothetical protein
MKNKVCSIFASQAPSLVIPLEIHRLPSLFDIIRRRNNSDLTKTKRMLFYCTRLVIVGLYNIVVRNPRNRSLLSCSVK